MARVIDGNNLYYARVEFSTSQQIILSVRKRVGGTETTLATVTTPLVHVAGTFVRLRFEVVGSLLRAKVWPVGAGEPEWQVTATDSDLTAAGTIGVRSILSSANTNTSPQTRYDNFACANPQTWTVVRSVNAISKSHAAGTDVRLATPAVVAL
ncbi:hypothetical protein ABZ250_08450 [Streptomyces afghaniensis]|uniref:hypothetical protein n=1 Tax=Streptomyces afghaniensis TaxID=66865 RepID=UPI0033B1AE91